MKSTMVKKNKIKNSQLPRSAFFLCDHNCYVDALSADTTKNTNRQEMLLNWNSTHKNSITFLRKEGYM
jgi:hypothetical protein